MKYLKLCLLNMLLIPAIVVAHGPSRQKVVQEIEINASADKVWKIIENFCSIEDWHPGISKCSTDNGSEIKSVRTIELENGEKINEILFKHDPENKPSSLIELSKLQSQMWRNLSSEDKAQYLEHAASKKDLYKKAMEVYNQRGRTVVKKVVV